MNNRLKFLMIAIVAIIFVAGCKKEINWDAFPNPDIQIDKPEEKNPCELTSFDFYDSGSLTKNWVIFHDNSGLITTVADGSNVVTYSYGTNNITTIDSDDKQIDITLENGRATKIAAVKGNYEIYTYNNEGYISNIKLYSNSILERNTDLTYDKGNLIKIEKSKFNNLLGDEREVMTIEYLSDLSDSNIRIIKPWYELVSDFFLPGNFYGKTSKNLIGKITNIRTINSDNFAYKETDVKSYSYAKDDKGNYNSVSLVETNKNSVNGLSTGNETYNFKYILYYRCN